MLIYLNAALVSWQTVNGRLSGAGSLGLDNAPIDRSLTRAQIYLLILVAAFIGIVIWVFGRKQKAPVATSLDRRQTRAFKGCSI